MAIHLKLIEKNKRERKLEILHNIPLMKDIVVTYMKRKICYEKRLTFSDSQLLRAGLDVFEKSVSSKLSEVVRR